VYEYSRLAAAATMMVTGAGAGAAAGAAGSAGAVSFLPPAKRLAGASMARNATTPNKTRHIIRFFLVILNFSPLVRHKIVRLYGKT
jgi:hypothetical protein